MYLKWQPSPDISYVTMRTASGLDNQFQRLAYPTSTCTLHTNARILISCHVTIGTYSFLHRPTFVRVEDQRCEEPDHFHEIIDWEVLVDRMDIVWRKCTPVLMVVSDDVTR